MANADKAAKKDSTLSLLNIKNSSHTENAMEQTIKTFMIPTLYSKTDGKGIAMAFIIHVNTG